MVESGVSQAGRLKVQALTMQPPQESRVGVWKTQMSLDERSRFEAVAGGLLAELGYADLIGTGSADG